MKSKKKLGFEPGDGCFVVETQKGEIIVNLAAVRFIDSLEDLQGNDVGTRIFWIMGQRPLRTRTSLFDINLQLSKYHNTE